SLIQLLGHHVSRLGIATTNDKVEVIHQMPFPKTLKQLETGIGFFNYYRRFVHHYTAIAEPINYLKTLQLRSAPRKGRAREEYTRRNVLQTDQSEPMILVIRAAEEAWQLLKTRLTTSPVLAYPDFTKPF